MATRMGVLMTNVKLTASSSALILLMHQTSCQAMDRHSGRSIVQSSVLCTDDMIRHQLSITSPGVSLACTGTETHTIFVMCMSARSHVPDLVQLSSSQRFDALLERLFPCVQLDRLDACVQIGTTETVVTRAAVAAHQPTTRDSSSMNTTNCAEAHPH